MENTLLRIAISAAATFAFAALPGVAVAETVVPPGNSAATQYTETFPTAGGNAEVNDSISGSGGRGGHSSQGGGRSPDKVLGSDTAHELESHGEEGQAVAELATESAAANQAGSGGSHRHTSGKADLDDAVPVGGSGGNASGDSNVVPSQAEGSSGVSGVLSHATGSSSGEMGILLPLVLLAVPLCALIYVWRRRQPNRAAH
jgi:hypothetical protein